MAQFHSLKQAVEVTGKSESTIKRLLTSIRKEPDSPDRQQLLPTVAQYDKLKESGTPFQWEISETLLQERYPDAFGASIPEKGTGNQAEGETPKGDARYIKNLEQQISRLQETNDELRQQNSTLTTSLTSLTDRVTNMLGHYQVKALGPADSSSEHLPPSETHQPRASVVDVDESPAAVDSEEGSGAARPTPKKPRASRKKSQTKKPSGFEKHTPTFHKAFTHVFFRK